MLCIAGKRILLKLYKSAAEVQVDIVTAAKHHHAHKVSSRTGLKSDASSKEIFHFSLPVGELLIALGLGAVVGHGGALPCCGQRADKGLGPRAVLTSQECEGWFLLAGSALALSPPAAVPRFYSPLFCWSPVHLLAPFCLAEMLGEVREFPGVIFGGSFPSEGRNCSAGGINCEAAGQGLAANQLRG